jgi:hypothetical protein
MFAAKLKIEADEKRLLKSIWVLQRIRLQPFAMLSVSAIEQQR